MDTIQVLVEEANALMAGAERLERSMSLHNTPWDVRKMCAILGIRLSAYRLYDTIDYMTNMPDPSDDEPVPF